LIHIPAPCVDLGLLRTLHLGLEHVNATGPSSVWRSEHEAFLGADVVLPTTSTCVAGTHAAYTLARGGAMWGEPECHEVVGEAGRRRRVIPASLSEGNVLNFLSLARHRRDAYVDLSSPEATLAWCGGYPSVDSALALCRTRRIQGGLVSWDSLLQDQGCAWYGQWWGQTLGEVVVRREFVGTPVADIRLTTQAWHLPAWPRWAVSRLMALEALHDQGWHCIPCWRAISEWLAAWAWSESQ
jgi:hypothetical protein